MDSIEQLLRQRVAAHPFLAGLNERQLEILADCAAPAHFQPNEMVFRAGDPARGFFLVESGRIAVEGGEDPGAPTVIDTVVAGEPLGWSWMWEPFICEYSARAIEESNAIFFDALRLAEHRGGDLTLGHELFKRMSQVMVRRLSAARRKLVSVEAQPQS